MPAPHRPNTYTLDELTSVTDVTVRTVRYYIAEGLLPPPEGTGRAARYSDEHRDRLEVIASLKDRHLPLKEIRRHLQGLTADEVAALAQETRALAREGSGYLRYDRQRANPDPGGRRHLATPDAAAQGASSALDYIRSIHEAPAHYLPPHVPSPQVGADQQWRRLSISPEAELIVSDDLYRRRREQIESLLAWAKHIMHEP